MNNLKLLKEKYSLSINRIDITLTISIKDYVTALEKENKELKEKLGQKLKIISSGKV